MGKDRRVPRAHLSVSIAQFVSSRFNDKPCLKKEIREKTTNVNF